MLKMTKISLLFEIWFTKSLAQCFTHTPDYFKEMGIAGASVALGFWDELPVNWYGWNSS
jgi:hypothetical protein